MIVQDVIFFGVFIGLLVLAAFPLGRYMAKIYSYQPIWAEGLFGRVEKLIYRVGGIDEGRDMGWKEYTLHLMLFNLMGLLFLMLLLMGQGLLPLNPEKLPGVGLAVAFNTAVSFVTNTNWQVYSGETTMSYISQMAGLSVQNFLSAATGISVAVAVARGFSRQNTQRLGNFWKDMTRSILYVLLPLCLVGSILLVSQGVIQNLNGYVEVSTLEGGHQTLPMGPVASQEIIKHLGTNGGGFFNANSAHPFENPNGFINFILMFSILIIPAALTITFGRMTGNEKQGRVLLLTMVLLFAAMLGGTYTAEIWGNPTLNSQNLSGPTALEGKEYRFGVGGTSLFAVVTTAASCGAVNAMHDSMTPLGGMVPMVQLMLGEIIFGGVGSGLYGMLIYVIMTVFIVGLMVGRTPEYLGKKIESFEMKMAVIALLVPPATILIGSAAAFATGAAAQAILNQGPHGLTEVLYALSSCAGNNGSAFAGLNGTHPYFILAAPVAMLIGRFGVILPLLAVAGSLANKTAVPVSPGTFNTGTTLFSMLLIGTILIVGALTFFPALALGPIAEHLIMMGL